MNHRFMKTWGSIFGRKPMPDRLDQRQAGLRRRDRAGRSFEVMEDRVHLTGGLPGPMPAAEVQATYIPLATGDFNGDGWLDMAVASPSANTVTIRLGNGDGTFRDTQPIPVGVDPSALIATDFNGDGRLDLAVADAGSNDVEILYGLGDGTFVMPMKLAVDSQPSAMAIGDFNNDGHVDLAVTNAGAEDVSILFGTADGSFLPAVNFAVGKDPVSILSYDFNSDGHLDLVVANHDSGDVSFLLGDGSGNFQEVRNGAVGMTPASVAMITLKSKNPPHLFVADAAFNGTWDIGPNYMTGKFYRTVLGANSGDNVITDFNNDGHVDAATVDPVTHQALVYLITDDGNYTIEGPIQLSYTPANLLVGDFNGDGSEDLAIANADTGSIEVRLGRGDGTFLPPQATFPTTHTNLQVVRFQGGGPTLALSLDSVGRLLVRAERPNNPGEFQAPWILNPSPNLAIRDFAIIRSSSGVRITALLAKSAEIQIYQFSDSGSQVTQTIMLPSSSLPSRIISGDLDNDGRDDLVVLARGTNQAMILYQDDQGQFSGVLRTINVNAGPSDAALIDIDGNGYPDLVVTDAISGNVSIIGNFPLRLLVRQVRLAAAGVDAQMVSVLAGQFGQDGTPDLAIVDRALGGITVMSNISVGQTADAAEREFQATGDEPSRIVEGDFNGDGIPDFVVLNQGTDDVTILLGNASGGFVNGATINVGDQPVDLISRDLDHDGKLDLLISDQSGDLLTLKGLGDGTFASLGRTNQVVVLVAGIEIGGSPAYVMSNSTNDQLSIFGASGGAIFEQGRADGLLAPTDVKVADVNGDGIPDLLLANTGDNDILIYLGQGGGYFSAPLRVFVGTSPVSITVADVDGDVLPEIFVANSGSNDVSVLLPVIGPSGWMLELGPRLKAGNAPVSTTVADANGDGISDLLIVNEGDYTVTMLRGLGGGFFDDRNPIVFDTGLGPIRAFVGHFSNSSNPGLVVVNSASNDLTYYPNILDPRTPAVTIPTGGIHPIAAVDGGLNALGYSQVIVAHDGDSRISVFAGSPSGLSVVNFVLLGESQRVTDIVVDHSVKNLLQVYVSTAGGGLILPISISFAIGMSPSSVSETPGPLQSPTLASSVTGLPLTLAYESGPIFTNSSQGSSAALATLGTMTISTSVGGSVGGSFGYAIQSVQPLAGSTNGSFSSLISSLMQVNRSQISDVLPLQSSSMATVAVLLTVNDRGQGSEMKDLEELSDLLGFTGGEGFDELSRSSRDGGFKISPTERFVSGVVGALNTQSLELNGNLDEDDGSAHSFRGPMPFLDCLRVGLGRSAHGTTGKESGDGGQVLPDSNQSHVESPFDTASRPDKWRGLDDVAWAALESGEDPSAEAEGSSPVIRMAITPLGLFLAAVAGSTIGWRAMASTSSGDRGPTGRFSDHSRKHFSQGL